MTRKGWKREPARHSLAARGVGSRRYGRKIPVKMYSNRDDVFMEYGGLKFRRPSMGENVTYECGCGVVYTGTDWYVTPCEQHGEASADEWDTKSDYEHWNFPCGCSHKEKDGRRVVDQFCEKHDPTVVRG